MKICPVFIQKPFVLPLNTDKMCWKIISPFHPLSDAKGYRQDVSSLHSFHLNFSTPSSPFAGCFTPEWILEYGQCFSLTKRK